MPGSERNRRCSDAHEQFIGQDNILLMDSFKTHLKTDRDEQALRSGKLIANACQRASMSVAVHPLHRRHQATLNQPGLTTPRECEFRG